MNEFFKYSIRSAPPVGAESTNTLGAKFLDTLDALNRIDPAIFANWEIMNFPKGMSLSLPAARAQIGAIVEANKDVSSDTEVLLRIMEGESVKTEKGFNADVIRFNNTQNVIKSSDFRSNDPIQLWLENRERRVQCLLRL